MSTAELHQPAEKVRGRPAEGDGRTFAQMSPAEKNAISHRGRALDAFARWLTERARED